MYRVTGKRFERREVLILLDERVDQSEDYLSCQESQIKRDEWITRSCGLKRTCSLCGSSPCSRTTLIEERRRP